MEELKQQNEGSCNNPGGSGSGEGQGNPMNQGNNGMSFSQRMQQIASEQQAVNQALQQMMQNGSGDGKTQMERQAQQARMADKQGSAQKSVEELIKEQKQFAGDKGKLGELEKIADEMKEIMSDIESRGATPETLKRQERILSRLLDLNRSENERDFEKKREGKTANDIFNQSPAALDLKNLEGNDKLFRDLLKNNQQGYTKDYENLIRAYFELIKEQ